MACQPIQPDHPDPLIYTVQRALHLSSEKVFFERTDFLQRFRMIENDQVFREFVRVGEIDGFQARRHLRQRGRVQSRSRQKQTQRIDVAPVRDAAQQGGFDHRGASAHKRVIDDLARFREVLDEKSRELWLEARAI